MDLRDDIRACTLCSDRFRATATAHAPRPVVWFEPSARILVAGQAPGLRVHEAGKPFFDPSGDRLRAWMGLTSEVFYDRAHIAVVPMAFCFPGYNDKGSDLPPPTLCARTWHSKVLGMLPNIKLTVLLGGYAIKWHLKTRDSVTAIVEAWRDYAPGVFVLPHPSWRNTAWLKRNPWFEADLVPVLQARVRGVLDA